MDNNLVQNRGNNKPEATVNKASSVSSVNVGDIGMIKGSDISSTSNSSNGYSDEHKNTINSSADVNIKDVGMIKNTTISSSSNMDNSHSGENENINNSSSAVNFGDVGMIKDSQIISKTTNIKKTIIIKGSSTDEKRERFRKKLSELIDRYGIYDRWRIENEIDNSKASSGLDDWREIANQFYNAYISTLNHPRFRMSMDGRHPASDMLSIDGLVDKLNSTDAKSMIGRKILVDINKDEDWRNIGYVKDIVTHPGLVLRCAITGNELSKTDYKICSQCGLIYDGRKNTSSVCLKCLEKDKASREHTADKIVVLSLFQNNQNDWKKIPAGEFNMGSPEEEEGRSSDEKQHRVRISKDYFVYSTPVSEQLFDSVMGIQSPSERANYPKRAMTWYQAINFCNEYSKFLGISKPYYRLTVTDHDTSVDINKDSHGIRLLTEAEWEHACRAGSESAYFIDCNGTKITKENLYTAAHYDEEEGSEMCKYVSNRFGLFDMLGLVREWVWDDKHNYNDSFAIDPQTSSRGITKIARGGSLSGNESKCRCAKRFYTSATQKSKLIGFRIAFDL